MKKVLALMLALVLVLSLSACGGSNDSGEKKDDTSEKAEVTLDKNDVANYLGEWETTHKIVVFEKGGIGKSQDKDDVNKGYYPFKYEINDGIVSATSQYSDWMASFELNEDGTTLNVVGGRLPGAIYDENALTKCK